MDVFRGPIIGECNGFELPGRELPLLKIFHRGSDGWIVDFIRIILDDRTYIQCDLGGELVDDTSDLSVANCRGSE